MEGAVRTDICDWARPADLGLWLGPTGAGATLDPAQWHAPPCLCADARLFCAACCGLCAGQSHQSPLAAPHGAVGQALGTGALAGQWQPGTRGFVRDFFGLGGAQLSRRPAA